VIDSASLPLEPTRSKTHAYALAALLLSGALAVGVAFAFELQRRPVETESDVVKATGFAVLGSVGTVKGRREARGPLYLPRVASDHLELYRGIRASIETERLKEEFRSILVTSAGPSVGKSTTVLNLAQVLQEFGRRVLIVEADLRRPSLYRAMAVTNKPGLPDFLRGAATFGQICRTLPSGVTLIPSGVTREDVGSLLQAAQIKKLLALAKPQFDVVLVDSAPLLVVSDTRLLLPALDRVVLVVKAGQTMTRELRQMQDLLRRADARVLGVVVNQANPRDMYYYTRQYAKYYRASEGGAAAKPAVPSLREKP
jgi:capsular exopolysaccharide synthesis family protein